MIKRLLIANRGEIAARIMRTARDMGIETVAVFSDADAKALHVEMADFAEHIGPPAVAESYLNMEAILTAAARSGADAIHPGYGFLSENPAFAEAVANQGLTFVGPSAQAMRVMGLKDAAKAEMEAAGVPVVPGYHGKSQDDDVLAEAASAIGFPVLIKAVAGGGGKGMRLVETPAHFAEALASARSEASSAFGNADVLIEKFITTPRHIEIQVFGDGTKAVHLYERDCSLQRRHQKVIEEAPAPNMPQEVRAAMGQAAVRAAEAIGYAGAGTVEFIVDGGGPLRTDGFWFMEMNTRLQVEHPVTEAITGIDLVEWQLRVASGDALPLAQDEIPLVGHSFEVRLYAEDAEAGFLPATGGLTHVEFPSGARVDSGVRAGDVISPWYDPMIAKIIVHAHDRQKALRDMAQALAGTRIAGCKTNHGFLRRLLADPDFQAGTFDTGLIDRKLGSLTVDPTPCTQTRAIAAVASQAFFCDESAGFTLWAPMAQRVALSHKETDMVLHVETRGNGMFNVQGERSQHLVSRENGEWVVDGVNTHAFVHRDDADLSVFWGNAYHFVVPDPLARTSDEDTGTGILAPMPGLVRTVSVHAGDTVEAGQALLTLEAMKMEHVLRAPDARRIEAVFVVANEQVEEGMRMIELSEKNA